jgi:hypothetical protein
MLIYLFYLLLLLIICSLFSFITFIVCICPPHLCETCSRITVYICMECEEKYEREKDDKELYDKRTIEEIEKCD